MPTVSPGSRAGGFTSEVFEEYIQSRAFSNLCIRFFLSVFRVRPTGQVRKNSPRHTRRALPRRNTLFFSQRTVCVPPGVCTRTGDCALPVAIAATADAHDPVPEDC